MLKKILLAASLMSMLNVVNAETCPSVSDIQQNNFHGWQQFDRDSGDPAPAPELQAFIAHVQTFTLGYFAPEAPEGEAQCYYQDQSGKDYMSVYLARQDLQPDEASSWTKSKSGEESCHAADVNECRFKEK